MMVLVRLLYKPFGLVATRVSRRIGRAAFRSVLSKIDNAPPPVPGSGQGSATKAVAGRALEAGVMAGAAAGVDRVFARVFHHLFGAWPKAPARIAEED
ncbi:MAG: hypothetical protein ACYC0H_03140 [Solirubrobacteraceae bacterium]